MSSATCLPLQAFYERERRHPQKPYMIQPSSDGRVHAFNWYEVGQQARRVAQWLRNQNLAPRSHIALISKNNAHWLITDLAIWMAGHVTVPLYPNLTAASVAHVLAHSESVLVFVGKLDDWSHMVEGITPERVTVSLPQAPLDSFDFNWDDLQACPPITDSPTPAAEQLATVIYTSGTTGEPKGVMHNFGALGYAASHATQLLGLHEHDRVISYLPLCHVAERLFVELASFYAGHCIYFSESLETFALDMQRARPTVFLGVPRIWSKFQQAVYSRMGERRLSLLLSVPMVRQRVARHILHALGLDAVRMGYIGASTVPQALMLWYRRLGLEVVEIYGMTENCGYSHVCRVGQHKPGWIGRHCEGVEVRIDPEGEVQMRSPALMMGYFKNPQLTREAFTRDGYLRTGDKGEQDTLGHLRLRGRIKEIFKTSKGKYVAPGPIEGKLAAHAKIEQVCVVGDGLAGPLGLCVLSARGREEAATVARARLQVSLETLLYAVNAGLDKHEQLRSLVVVKDSWGTDNGFLTPTLKIKRTVIEDTYSEWFERWGADSRAVQWQDGN